MKDLYVDHAALTAAGDDFARGLETLHGILSGLEADLAPLVSSWAGSARDLYGQKKAEWDAAAADLASLLSTITRHTRSTAESYARLVAETTAAWS